MTEKELRKLNRYQLLELLVIQTERADKLQQKLELAEKQLGRQDIRMSVMGSIAEASLQLGGVFEAAQDAADLYLDAAKERAREIEEEALQRAEVIIREAEERARSMTKEHVGFWEKLLE